MNSQQGFVLILIINYYHFHSEWCMVLNIYISNKLMEYKLLDTGYSL